MYGGTANLLDKISLPDTSRAKCISQRAIDEDRNAGPRHRKCSLAP